MVVGGSWQWVVVVLLVVTGGGGGVVRSGGLGVVVWEWWFGEEEGESGGGCVRGADPAHPPTDAKMVWGLGDCLEGWEEKGRRRGGREGGGRGGGRGGGGESTHPPTHQWSGGWVVEAVWRVEERWGSGAGGWVWGGGAGRWCRDGELIAYELETQATWLRNNKETSPVLVRQ